MKRNNWTNQEIISMLKQHVYTEPQTLREEWVNVELDNIIDQFEAFDYPPETFGAFAMRDDGEIVHIGQIPECSPSIKTQ